MPGNVTHSNLEACTALFPCSAESMARFGHVPKYQPQNSPEHGRRRGLTPLRNSSLIKDCSKRPTGPVVEMLLLAAKMFSTRPLLIWLHNSLL